MISSQRGGGRAASGSHRGGGGGSLCGRTQHPRPEGPGSCTARVWSGIIASALVQPRKMLALP
eukprot:2374910-Heterocapsa_arctica.AAC.1